MYKCIIDRLLSAIIITAIFLSLSSCGSTGGKKEGRSADKKIDLKGYPFVIMGGWLADHDTGKDIGEHLFWEQIKRTEEKLNCDIQIVQTFPTLEALQPKIMAGKKFADILQMSPTVSIPAAKAEFIAPWEDVKGIDLNSSVWTDFSKNLGKFDGKQYGIDWKRPVEARKCIFYNKDILKSSGITDDLPALVKSGQWTFDKFAQIAKTVTRSIGGDKKIYGISVIDPIIFGTDLISANGGSMVQFTGGKATLTYDQPPFLQAYEFYNKLVNIDKSFRIYDYMKSPSTWNSGNTVDDKVNDFINGEVMFFEGEMWIASQKLKAKSDILNYGILPLPKGPSAKDYVSTAENAAFYCIPANNTDNENTVTVLKELTKPVKGYEGEDWWLDEVNDANFRKDDKDSIDMYKLILEKSMFDYGYAVSDVRYQLSLEPIGNGIFWGTSTPAQFINSLSKQNMQDQVDAVFKQNQ